MILRSCLDKDGVKSWEKLLNMKECHIGKILKSAMEVKRDEVEADFHVYFFFLISLVLY